MVFQEYKKMKTRDWIWTLVVGTLGLITMLIFGAVLGNAQQPAAAKGKGKAPTAPPPINWPSPPLADGPIVLDTAI